MSKFCSTCGMETDNNASFCSRCGSNVFVMGAVPQYNNTNNIRCPKCGNVGCTLITEHETQNKDFNTGNACCGYLMFGWEGILCGLCGTGSKTRTRNYWICPSCGKKFGA